MLKWIKSLKNALDGGQFQPQWYPAYNAFVIHAASILPVSENVVTLLMTIADQPAIIQTARLILEMAGEEEDDVLILQLREMAGRVTDDVAPRGMADLISNLIRRAEMRYTVGIVDSLLENRPTVKPMRLCLPPIVRKLARLLDLTLEEQRILTVIFIAEESEAFHDVARMLSNGMINNLLASAADMDVSRFYHLVGAGSRLLRLGLIKYNGDIDSLNCVVTNFRLGTVFRTGSTDHITRGLFLEDRAARFGREDFDISGFDWAFIVNLLRAGKTVLIYGAPGIGKSEFAYTLGDMLGKKILSLSAEMNITLWEKTKTAKERMKMVFLAAYFVNQSAEILLVDEADALLQSAGGFSFQLESGGGAYDKGEINVLLDDLKVPVLWISNDISRIPASTLRRFAFVYKFPGPNKEARLRMLSDRVRKENLPVSRDYLRNVIEEYQLTPSAIDRLVTAVSSSLPELKNASRSLSVTESAALKDISFRYLKAMSRVEGTGDFKHRKGLPPTFNLDLCNSSIPAPEVEALVRRRRGEDKPTRLLFTGAPGGGKTQFALYLAETLGMDPLVMKPSDLLSKWVGEAEKNIAGMFSEAESMGALLIIDEAEALLMNRTGLVRSWEMSQAAEWLQGIQNFSGTLVACTNLPSVIDPAIRRRFHRHIAFDPLRQDQLFPALALFFPNAGFQAGDADALAEHSLMISDFAAAAEMLEDENDKKRILDELTAQADARNPGRKIGF